MTSFLTPFTMGVKLRLPQKNGKILCGNNQQIQAMGYPTNLVRQNPKRPIRHTRMQWFMRRHKARDGQLPLKGVGARARRRP